MKPLYNKEAINNVVDKINKLRALILLSLPAVIAVVLSYILQFTVIVQPERFANWLSSFGPFVILVYAIVQSVTLLIPPLGGTFILIGMLAILGPAKGLLLSYLVTTPIYCVNFLLSKKFGRPLVQKVAGKGGMAKIDQYTADAGVGTLWILKIFENGYFDFISYAVGLTNISFRNFIIVNFIGGIPSTLIYYFILTKSPNFLTSMILIQVMAGALIAVSIIIKHLKDKNKIEIEK